MNSSSYGMRLAEDPATQEVARFKAALYRNLRTFLEEEGAVELPMPILWRTREGAPQDQWRTCDPVTGEQRFIRHCMEDHLRRMTTVFPRIFELGKAVRAERVTDWHAAEFTVLELAWADTSYDEGIGLVQRLLADPVASTITALFGPERAEPFRHLMTRTWDSIATEVIGTSPSAETFTEDCLRWLGIHGIETAGYVAAWEPLEDLMKHGIEPACTSTTLIRDFARELQHVCAIDSSGHASRLSLVMHGVEFADGGLKFDDAGEYRRIYERNAKYRRDVLGLDQNDLPEDFFEELTAASQKVFTCGIGLDRLVALVLDRTVHDVIQFPEG